MYDGVSVVSCVWRGLVAARRGEALPLSSVCSRGAWAPGAAGGVRGRAARRPLRPRPLPRRRR